MNTIGNKKIEKYFYDYYNEFEYNQIQIKSYNCKLMKYSYIYISIYTKYNYTYMCKSMYIFCI